MTLPLPGGPLPDHAVQAKFDEISLKWPNDSLDHTVPVAPTYTNAWVDFGGGFTAVSYYRDRGRVYLDGMMKNGTVATSAFTLPVGFRPAAQELFIVIANNIIGRVDVSTAGLVTPSAGTSNVYVSLCGISFVAA
jgi:hypothetical protein